jgi:hypothetical protein
VSYLTTSANDDFGVGVLLQVSGIRWSMAKPGSSRLVTRGRQLKFAVAFAGRWHTDGKDRRNPLLLTGTARYWITPFTSKNGTSRHFKRLAGTY